MLRTAKAPTAVSTSILAGAKALEKETAKLQKLSPKKKAQKAPAVRQMARGLKRVTQALPKSQIAPATRKAVAKATLKAAMETSPTSTRASGVKYWGIDPKQKVLESTLKRTGLRTDVLVNSGSSGAPIVDEIDEAEDELYFEEADEDDGQYEDSGSYYSSGGGGGGYYSTGYDGVEDTGVYDDEGYYDEEVYDEPADDGWSEEDIDKAIQEVEGELTEAADEAEGLFAKFVDMVQEHPVITTAIGAGAAYLGYRYWQQRKG